MIIGFTGTQEGCTATQFNKLRIVLDHADAMRIHHGDCLGADEQFHYLSLGLGIVQTYIHPPINESKRAFCHIISGGKIFSSKEYLDRNKDIVDASEFLIGCPKDMKEVLRSGTWSTIRYTQKKEIPGIIIYPNGELQEF